MSSKGFHFHLGTRYWFHTIRWLVDEHEDLDQPKMYQLLFPCFGLSREVRRRGRGPCSPSLLSYLRWSEANNLKKSEQIVTRKCFFFEIGIIDLTPFLSLLYPLFSISVEWKPLRSTAYEAVLFNQILFDEAMRRRKNRRTQKPGCYNAARPRSFAGLLIFSLFMSLLDPAWLEGKGESQVSDPASPFPLARARQRYQEVAASLGSLSSRNRIIDLYSFLCLPLILPAFKLARSRLYRGSIQAPL